MLKATAHYNYAYDRLDLYVRENINDGRFMVWTEVLIKEQQSGLVQKPLLEDAKEFLQACCDAAWEAGIYPRQLADKTDELKATKYHLEDMRSLVFKINKARGE